ncbi:MAG TPA: M20/M25/M40 family metallo-hydrolase [Longimicrobiaceae bacterium]
MGPITVPFRRALLPVAAWATLASGCGVGSASRAEASAGTDPEAVRRSLYVLAADSMEGRMTGSPGAARAARFIAEELRRYGVPPAYPAASGRDSAYFQGIPLVRGADDADLRLLPSWDAMDTIAASRRVRDVNVIGVIRGADPRLREEAVIVGAHYDHVGIGRPVMGDSIYNGADDDASGVVTVLEVARALASGPPPRRTVIFLLTSGEELGLLGTRWYLRRPVVPLSATVADLQVEMVARPDSAAGGPGRGWLTGYERSSLGRSLAEAGVPIVPDPRPAQRFFERSDNIAFACRGIPAHTLSSYGMHDDYHRPSDDADAVDLAHLTALIDAATRAVRLLADGARATWSPDGDPSRNAEMCGG